MNRKDRRAARATAMTQKRRGRPSGPLPLWKDARRFEAVAYYVGIRRELKPIEAAGRAVIILGWMTETESSVGRLTFTFVGPRRDSADFEAFFNRRGKILREAPEVIKRAAGPDRYWLERSAMWIEIALEHLQHQHWVGVHRAVVELNRLGWGHMLRRFDVISDS